MRSTLKKYRGVIFLIIGILVMIQLYMHNYFSLNTIIHNKDVLRSLVTNYYPYAVFFYITLYAVAVICLLPFISIITMLGGFLFGPVWATLFVVIGAITGIMILVSLMRYFFKNKMLFTAHFLQKLNSMIERHGVAYLLCVRFIVVIPFFIVNSVIAFTPMHLFTIAWTTGLGIVPITFLCASAGSHLEQINNITDLFSLKIIIIFGCLIFVSLLPIILEKLNIKL